MVGGSLVYATGGVSFLDELQQEIRIWSRYEARILSLKSPPDPEMNDSIPTRQLALQPSIPTTIVKKIPKKNLDLYPDHYNSSFHSAIEAPHDLPPNLSLTLHRNWFGLVCRSQGIRESDAHFLTLPKSLADVLVRASRSGIITGRLGASDLEDILDIPNDLTPLDLSGGCFVRLDLCSTKDGLDTPKPVYSVDDVWKRIVTSHRAICSIKSCFEQELAVQLYLTPWNPLMNTKHEWRVFIAPQNMIDDIHVSAISQYSWHQVIHTDFGYKKAEMIIAAANEILTTILESNFNTIKQLTKQGFVFDFLLAPPFDNRPVLVELNTFGSRSGCGSGLFHWIKDHDQMYGKSNSLELRVLVD